MAPVLPQANTKYDAAARRRTKRAGRQRGCAVYVPAEVLVAAGIDVSEGPPPYCRVWAGRGGSVLVRFYREG